MLTYPKPFFPVVVYSPAGWEDWHDMLRSAFLLAAIFAAAVLSVTAASADSRKGKRWHTERAAQDCTPINGRYGYYGNPWCDTGSYRPPDIEFRERRALQMRRWKAPR